MTHLNLRIAVTALALAVGSPAVVACSDAPPVEDVAQTGTLNAALLTVGSDGATYQFPQGTLVRISQGNYVDTFALDGTETSLNLELPTGTLEVQLQFPSMTPQLIRTLGAASTVVDVVWLDTPPVLVGIAPDATTALTLHFSLSGLGDVTFDMGTLALALDVQRNTTAQPAELFESGTYIHNSSLFGASATPIAQFLFGMVPGEGHDHFFDFNVTGAWQQQSAERICAQAIFDAFTTMDGESAFSRLVNIVIQQTAVVCIDDFGMSDKFFVNTTLSGAAPPPYNTGALPGTNYSFFLSVSGFVGDVYDGQTFRQSNLETFTSFNGGEVLFQIFDNTILPNGENTLLSQGGLSGNVRLVP